MVHWYRRVSRRGGCLLSPPPVVLVLASDVRLGIAGHQFFLFSAIAARPHGCSRHSLPSVNGAPVYFLQCLFGLAIKTKKAVDPAPYR